jgi:tripartite-type tricarboxylate transporter receptor subunit TctC
VGNPVHLGSALLENQTGTKMEHVIYKETSQLYQGVANGELTFALGSLGTAGPLVRGGKLRFLAVAAPSRIAGFENVPTVSNRAAPRISQPSAGTPWPCAPAPLLPWSRRSAPTSVRR